MGTEIEVEGLPCRVCGKPPMQQDGYLARLAGREPGWFCPGHTMEMPLDEWNAHQLLNTGRV